MVVVRMSKSVKPTEASKAKAPQVLGHELGRLRIGVLLLGGRYALHAQERLPSPREHACVARKPAARHLVLKCAIGIGGIATPN